MAIGDSMAATPIPTVGESGTGYASKIVAFLTEVKARLEAKVPLSSLLAGLFDLSNNPVGNMKYAGLYEQTVAPATPVGSLQRYGGELYYVSPSGAVRITNSGNLDVVGANGITGDYAAPAEFKYVVADLEYYAYSDASASPKKWAYLGSRAVDIYGTLQSTARIRLSWTGSPTASYTLTLPPAVPADTRVLKLDTGGNMVTTLLPAKTRGIHLGTGYQNSTVTTPHTKTENRWTLVNDTAPILLPITLDTPDTLQRWDLRLQKVSNATCTLNVELRRYGTSGSYTVIGGTQSTNVDGSSGAQTVDLFATFTEGATHNVQYCLAIQKTGAGSSAGDQVVFAYYTYQGYYL